MQKHNVYLRHIESRSSRREASKYEFMVECAPGGDLKDTIENLKANTTYLNIISRDYENRLGKLRHNENYRLVLKCILVIVTNYHRIN